MYTDILHIEFHHQINLVYDNYLYTCTSIIKMVYTNVLCNKTDILFGKYLDHWCKVMWNQLMLTVNRLFTGIRSHHGEFWNVGRWQTESEVTIPKNIATSWVVFNSIIIKGMKKSAKGFMDEPALGCQRGLQS